MGIPFYYSDLIKKYPDIKIKPSKIDILFFDYNGLIHPVAHDTVCKNTHENIFFNLLWKKTMDLVDKVKPNLTKIYIDGVAPLAKINQQRKRRYISEKNTVWDTNAITCGTPFMIKLVNYISKKHIYVDTIFNPGEGEHKIIDYIHNDTNFNNTYMIHGLDADLILLSLMSNKANNIYLMREQDNNITYISISKIKHYIELEWGNIFSPNADIIKSYCVMLSILGNDFIPHLLTLKINNNGINILKNVCNNTCLISKDNEETINKDQLQIIFKKLIYYEDKIMTNKNWRKDYYNNEVYINNVPLSCSLYLDGIYWTYNYYNKNINKIDHDWYYPFLGPPTIADIANNIITYNYKPNFDNTFINMAEQLLTVIPKKSIDILPDNLKKYMLDKSYGLEYIFVSEFKLIKFLKKFEWEYTPYLPLIDIHHIRNILTINQDL